MKLYFTPEARADLLELAIRIAERSPIRAVTYVDEIEARCRHILDFPHAGAPRPHWGDGVRMSVHGKYLVVYRVRDESVQILRVVHGARDLNRLFDDEPLPS